MANLLLIHIAGTDQPGITTRLLKELSDTNHKIIDMGQAVTHGLLSLSILIDTDNPIPLESLLKTAKEMQLELNFKILERNKLDIHTANSYFNPFILSVVSSTLPPAIFLKEVTSILASEKINIRRIENIHREDFHVLEFTTNPTVKIPWEKSTLKNNLLELGDKYKTDLAFVEDNIFRRNKRLIVMDMDSTLIQAEIIDLLAEENGVGKEVSEITLRAMNGELDFKESLIERVHLLKGLKQSQLSSILEKVELTPGVPDFIKTVKKIGLKVALVSGGFTFCAQRLKDKLGLDYAFANTLEIINGELTGKVIGNIIDSEQKAFILEFLAQQENIDLQQVVAIGDGANDIPMLKKAGMGIAFKAKELVKRDSSQYLGHGPMTHILYFLGIQGPIDGNDE